MTPFEQIGQPLKLSECLVLYRMRTGHDNHSLAVLVGIKYQTLIERLRLNNFKPKEKERISFLINQWYEEKCESTISRRVQSSNGPFQKFRV